MVGKWMLKSAVYWKIRAWNGKYEFAGKLGKLFGARKVESVIQDVEIPIENCTKFISFFHKEIGIKPVWICPVKTHKNYDLYPMSLSKLYVNFGFWDVVKTKHADGHYNKMIEKKVKELGGKKSLYSTSFYSEKEFWELYNKKRYDQLKRKYDPKCVFKNLYEKCVIRL